MELHTLRDIRCDPNQHLTLPSYALGGLLGAEWKMVGFSEKETTHEALCPLFSHSSSCLSPGRMMFAAVLIPAAVTNAMMLFCNSQ